MDELTALVGVLMNIAVNDKAKIKDIFLNPGLRKRLFSKKFSVDIIFFSNILDVSLVTSECPMRTGKKQSTEHNICNCVS
jgi:hypothetical protein